MCKRMILPAVLSLLYLSSGAQAACEGGWDISNVQLNGGGASVTVQPGESVRLQYDYQVWNGTACPGCIRQILAGLVKGAWSDVIDDCAYSAVPAVCPNKTSGSFDHTFNAPTGEGTYEVVAAMDLQYNCVDAKDRFPTQPYKQTIATIKVGCEGGWTVSNVRLNGGSTSVTVEPGDPVRLQYDYQVWNGTAGPTAIRQVLAGLVKGAWSEVIDNCAYSAVPVLCPNKTSGSFDHTFNAPMSPGTYQVVAAMDLQYTCNDAKNRFPEQPYTEVAATITVECEFKASNPDPHDGATDVPLDVELSWEPGCLAVSHDVYFGTNSPPAVMANQTASSYNPGTLQPGTTYYWQIDGVEPDGVTKHPGDLWSFTTVCINVAPTVDIGPDQIVNQGDVVVFSPDFTDPDELDSHTATWDFGDETPPVSWPYKKCKFEDRVCPAHQCSVAGRLGVCGVPLGSNRCVCNTVTGAEILITHTYGDAGVYTVTLIVDDDNGGVGFDEMIVTVLPAVEDFESYVDHADLEATWKDGSMNESGSTVEISIDPVHGGAQAMSFAYNNLSLPYYSETERTFETPQDWTRNGVKALSLWVYAEPDNDAECMYIGIGDGANEATMLECECLHDDIGYDCAIGWQEWNIDLREFSDPGVDLTSIKKMYIGVGDRGASEPGGKGTLYIDDIRLCPPRCIPPYKPLADLTGDCVVDYADLEIMAREWLVSGSGLKADLYSDDRVDLKDLAFLGDLWLEVQPWKEEAPIPVVVFPKEGSILTHTELVIAGLLNDDTLAPHEISRVNFQCSQDGMTWSTFDRSGSPMDNFWSSNFDEWDASWDTSALLPGPYLIRIEMDTIYGQVGRSEPISVTVNMAPVPQAAVVPSWPQGSVTLDASASFDPDGTIDAYMWDFGDGTTAVGATVDHVYEPFMNYEVVLTVVDNWGVLTSAFYQLFIGELVMLTPAEPNCICRSIKLRGDDLAERDPLGPDGDGKQSWGGPNDPSRLGPLHDDPRNPVLPTSEKTATGYAFEIVAEVDGDPKHCKEIQLIKRTYIWKMSGSTTATKDKKRCEELGGTWDAANSICTLTSHAAWSGTTSDLDLDGINDVNVSDANSCKAAGGTWVNKTKRCENILFPQSGTKYRPDGPNDDKSFHAYRAPYTHKKHPDKKIIWFDAPHFTTARGGPLNGTTYKADFIALVKGTDCKYCYVKFSVELERKAGKDKEELKQTEKKVGADEPPTVPKVP